MGSDYIVGIDLRTSAVNLAVLDSGSCLDDPTHPSEQQLRSVPAAGIVVDGEVLVGEPAIRHAQHIGATTFEFLDAVGSAVPIALGDSSAAAHDLLAKLIESMISPLVSRRGAPQYVGIAYPAGWGPYRQRLLRTALNARGLRRLTFVPRVDTVAGDSRDDLPREGIVAILDIDAAGTELAVLRIDSTDGPEQLAGIDTDRGGTREMDRLLLAHLAAARPGMLGELDSVRRACSLTQIAQRVRESIAVRSEIIVDLTSIEASPIRVVRAEYDEILAPCLDEIVEAFDLGLVRAGIGATDLTAIVLTGDGARVPAVLERLSATYDRPITVDADPRFTVCVGAALRAEQRGIMSVVDPPEHVAANRQRRHRGSPARPVPHRGLARSLRWSVVAGSAAVTVVLASSVSGAVEQPQPLPPDETTVSFALAPVLPELGARLIDQDAGGSQPTGDPAFVSPATTSSALPPPSSGPTESTPGENSSKDTPPGKSHANENGTAPGNNNGNGNTAPGTNHGNANGAAPGNNSGNGNTAPGANGAAPASNNANPNGAAPGNNSGNGNTAPAASTTTPAAPAPEVAPVDGPASAPQTEQSAPELTTGA